MPVPLSRDGTAIAIEISAIQIHARAGHPA